MSNQLPSQGSPADFQEIERNAFNFAFSELGLCWYWDQKTYAELQAKAVDADPLRTYVETEQRHLLAAYDTDFLVDAIRVTQARCVDEARLYRQAH